MSHLMLHKSPFTVDYRYQRLPVQQVLLNADSLGSAAMLS